jgi:hypothetical protein
MPTFPLPEPPPAIAAPQRFFGIQVIDEATGRGVPLVTLRTTGEVVLVTDSAGRVAFEEPGMMDRPVWFSIASHGYTIAPDGFGFRGVRLIPTAGGSAIVKITRVNIAERLYRITGAGVYRDSLLLGATVPRREPLLAGAVVGQDTVQAALYKGRLRWFWGDTNRPDYPLGNFHTSGATSDPTADPDRTIDLEYLTDNDGFSRALLPIDAPGPVWISGLATVDDGVSLICTYARMKDLGTCLERGLAVFDDAAQQFVRRARFPESQPAPISGHPFLAQAGGTRYLFGTREGIDPLPAVRVSPTVAALSDPARYEAFTRTKTGGWGWVPGGAPSREPLALRAIETDTPVTAHVGSVSWNPYRRRWIMLVEERGGKPSLLGEIWFAEADTPVGPWVWARKIVTHDRYDFYNPTQHPFFDTDGGRRIYFEGTYVNTFSGNPEATPRYNYNQILYRLDLADPRLVLPVPVYRVRGGGFATRATLGPHPDPLSVAFFALPPGPPTSDRVPVWSHRGRFVATAPNAGDEPLFAALPETRRFVPGTIRLPGTNLRVWKTPRPDLPVDFSIVALGR